MRPTRDANAEALRESEKRYRELVELCPDGILISTDSKIAFANEALAEILGGATVDELIGKPVMKIVHPDFHAATFHEQNNHITR